MRWIVVPLLLFCLSAVSSPIPGVFSTGINPDGSILTGGNEAHWKLIAQDGSVRTPVFSSNPGWIASPGNSAWIGPPPELAPDQTAGLYRYRLEFNMTDLDTASAKLE